MDYMKPNQLGAFAEACRERGLSVTAQRLAIYKDMCATDTHPTAEEVYGRIRKSYPTMSLATVYKTLETFEKYGFISKTHASGQKARFDANKEPHHHLICVSCGRIEDVECEALEGLKLSTSGAQHFGRQAFQIDLRGLCKNCQT